MTIVQSGGEAVVARLTGVRDRMRDVTAITAIAAADTMTLIDDSFAGSRAPDGSAWAPLAASTVARRRAGSATPLIDTGRLRSSVFARGDARGLIFGTNVGYAGPHQNGTSNGRPPRRAFLPVSVFGGSWSLMSGGPAGAHWTRVREAIARFISTGEVRL